jgi:hypothetical protein
MSDSLRLGLGLQTTDDLNNWLDTTRQVLGLLIQVADDASGSTDSVAVILGHLATSSDDLANLTDSLMLGLGMLLSDTLTQTDQTVLGYGLLVSDSLSLTDDCNPALGELRDVSDDCNNWQDSVITGDAIINLYVVAADSLSNWLDDINVVLTIVSFVLEVSSIDTVQALLVDHIYADTLQAEAAGVSVVNALILDTVKVLRQRHLSVEDVKAAQALHITDLIVI